MRSRHPVSAYVVDAFDYRPAYAVTPGLPAPGFSLPTPSSHWSNGSTRYRNINLLSIAYAFRPQLRSRLTLRRLALLRNPWVFGGHVSHMSFVTHASILTSHASTARLPRPLQSAWERSPTTPTRGSKSAASVPVLSPVTSSAHEHLTSELLRTLSRVAASKPTSWLSVHPHIVSHLDRI